MKRVDMQVDSIGGIGGIHPQRPRKERWVDRWIFFIFNKEDFEKILVLKEERVPCVPSSIEEVSTYIHLSTLQERSRVLLLALPRM